MKLVLLKDVVIPAGTIFDDAPIKTERAEGCFVDCVIGLTKDTAGTFTYEVSNELNEWFAEVK
jgi:hypothetical protein